MGFANPVGALQTGVPPDTVSTWVLVPAASRAGVPARQPDDDVPGGAHGIRHPTRFRFPEEIPGRVHRQDLIRRAAREPDRQHRSCRP